MNYNHIVGFIDAVDFLKGNGWKEIAKDYQIILTR